MTGTVRLPTLRLLKVAGYPMYPGRAAGGDGFEHGFQPGLNVIVGVNGLGKTTLLNILFRMLVGRYEPKKADRQEPGAKLHELTELRQFDYFAARIGGDARGARVSLELLFDKEAVSVTRNLGPSLDILELRHNRKLIKEPSEEKYLDLVRELSGIESVYDWDFVVRNLLFFFEEKIPLIWNPKGQFEILRILFLDNDLSAKCALLHDEIMAEDSQTRNLSWHIDRVEAAMAERLTNLQASADDVKSLGDIQHERDVCTQQIEMLEAAEADLQKKLRDLEHEIFTGKMQLHERGIALERSRVEYLRNAFPSMGEVTQIVFGRLFSGETCMLCRNPSSYGQERLKKVLNAEKCPACEAALQSAHKIASTKKLSDTRLQSLEKAHRDLDQSVKALEGRRVSAQSELIDVQEKLNGKLAERVRLEQRIDRALALAGESTGITREREVLDAQKRELDTRRSRLQAKRRRYDSLLERARDKIGEVANEIVATFADFAQSFILEQCKLTYEMDQRYVGQGGIRMNFPSFALEMTSAVLAIPTLRHEQEEVSESQKEFIDLAFRMALLKAANRGRGSLLVIETPEASLDSIFIDRAGQMLHDFAHGRGNSKNQVIATSNLNKENMIPALLGLKTKEGRIRKADADIKQRVVNLLELAAPSRAYADFKAQYDQSFKDALGL